MTLGVTVHYVSEAPSSSASSLADMWTLKEEAGTQAKRKVQDRPSFLYSTKIFNKFSHTDNTYLG